MSPPTPIPAPRPARRNALHPLGVTYHPFGSDPASGEEWYSGDIDRDFEQFASSGLTVVRIYVSWRLLEPQVGQYAEEITERLAELVQIAGVHRLRLIVCFFAELPRAGLLDVAWGQKRDPHTDSYLMERQAALVRHVVGLHRSDRAVFAWELANEAFCAGFTSTTELETWFATMRDAVRELDPDRPVMLGADCETLYHATRVDVRDVRAQCEVVTSRPTGRYRSYIAEGPATAPRATYVDSFLLHVTGSGRPVLLDDVGPHGLELSHAEEAGVVRCALYGGLMNGASGALLRRWRDVTAEPRTPYWVDQFEALSGVRDPEGVPKAALRELDRFARTLSRLDLRRYTRAVDRVAVMMPSERMASSPTLASLYAPRACLEAFVRAKEAHLPVTVVREEESFDRFAMVIVPSVTDLADDTWQRLAAWVQGGGSLVYSFGGGEFGPVARELFGVDFLGHGGARATATCRVAQRGVLGDLAPFDVRAEVRHFALLGPGASTVVATDAAGSPLLTLSRPGQGRAVCIAAPLERVLGQTGLTPPPAEIGAFLRTVYGAVGEVAGCGSKVGCDAPEVEIALLDGDEDDVVLLLNHHELDLTATVRFERPVTTVLPVAGGDPVDVGGPSFGVPLAPFGAAALVVRYR